MPANYDVIIIGAGPAGLNCAYHLQKSPKRVLLIEKNNTIGPKVCAGGLTQKDLDYLNLPANIIGRSFPEITYRAQFISTVIKMDNPFIYTIDRIALARWQLAKINSRQIDVLTGMEVTKIFSDHIQTKSGTKYFYKYLVGSDGSASIVRRYLKLKTEYLGIGMQYIMPAGTHDKFELHYNPKFFQSWYAWIFPHKNFVSIGTGGDSKQVPANKMHENLKKWMTMNNFDFTKGTFEAAPINNDYRGYKFNNIFLAGDAAGLASEFNGEGIYQALISGEEIARTILNPKYRPDKLKQILSAKRGHAKVLKILNQAAIFRPLLLELIGLGFKSKFLTKKAFSYILN